MLDVSLAIRWSSTRPNLTQSSCRRPASGKPTVPIEGTSAVLENGKSGAAMAMNSSGLNPGDMLTSSRTGCTHESLPNDCQATALADGVKGEFSCKTVQAALFPLAESQPEIKRRVPHTKAGCGNFLAPLRERVATTRYFVPNIRSPASPSPGTIYPFSFNRSSSAAVTTGTSG